jgi:hypothetical protein
LSPDNKNLGASACLLSLVVNRRSGGLSVY